MIEDIFQLPTSVWLFSITAIAAAFVLLAVRKRATARISPVVPAGALFVVAAGFLVGVGTWSLREHFRGHSHPDALIGLTLLSVIGLRLAWQQRKSSRLLGTSLLTLEAGSLWAGYWLGCTLVHGSIWDDLAFVAIAGAAITAVVGAFVVLIRPSTVQREGHHASA